MWWIFERIKTEFEITYHIELKSLRNGIIRGILIIAPLRVECHSMNHVNDHDVIHDSRSQNELRCLKYLSIAVVFVSVIYKCYLSVTNFE